MKAAHPATRALCGAGQQDVGLTIGKSKLGNTLADAVAATHAKSAYLLPPAPSSALIAFCMRSRTV
jgi:hypothetical protein